MQDSWLRKKAEEILSFADQKDMKKFHDVLETSYCPKCTGATPLLSADGSTLLTDKDAILERWTEHFNIVLNRPSSVNDNTINRMPQIECNVLLDEHQLSVKQGKQFNICLFVKHQIQMQFLLMFIKLTTTNGRKTDIVVSMHVEEGGYPTRLQGCFHNPTIQTERKYSSL